MEVSLHSPVVWKKSVMGSGFRAKVTPFTVKCFQCCSDTTKTEYSIYAPARYRAQGAMQSWAPGPASPHSPAARLSQAPPDTLGARTEHQ